MEKGNLKDFKLKRKTPQEALLDSPKLPSYKAKLKYVTFWHLEHFFTQEHMNPFFASKQNQHEMLPKLFVLGKHFEFNFGFNEETS